jgi:aspartate/methionine/tyrosine aminotransferase
MREIPVNRHVLEMEYAVRGPIPQRAAELARQGRRTIPCNIGNPQALGQRPITYYRQVLSLVEMPERIERERQLVQLQESSPERVDGIVAQGMIPTEVIDVAAGLLDRLPTGVGAYTESAGFEPVRQAVARFIDARDGVGSGVGVPADPSRIFLTNGASEGAKYILEMLLTKPSDGVMIPIPQYPLYSATICKLGGTQVSYYPDEDSGWTLSRETLVEPLQAAERSGVDVRAIVVINPGNPTGAIVDEASQRVVLEVAREYGLSIIADEVYQDNLYGHDWHSFASILGDATDVSLFSLHSVSKGFFGECGHRGGYLEVRNPPRVEGTDLLLTDVLVKQASVNLCPNTMGQVLTYLMVTPPPEGTPARRQLDVERQAVLDGLLAKARMIREYFQQMEGVHCFGRIGAMYLFPRLEVLPAGTTDFDYCMALLEATGITTVNGSGFGQRPGTHHLRVAFLPPRELIEEVLPEWVDFHNRYVRAGR